ncbi:MAG: chordopoxvirus fusion protein [Firmicutes bacterium]|nr:chordopoxvirus fusion protein [Bacillota bacterium]
MRYENVHSKLQTVFPPEQAAVLAEVIHEAYTDLVKTSDFNELKEIVRELSVKMGELAEAQKETQKEVGRLDRALQELAEAQKQSETRLTRLEAVVGELAEAQKRTEQRVEELAEAQRGSEARLTRLEAVVGELAEAQKRTEEELRKLIGEHAETRRQLGGLATTVGYRLEDEAFKALPALLERDHGLVVKGRLTRKFVRDNRGEDIEVNIVGQAERNGRTCTIVGESKSQLSKKDVDAFIRKKLRRLEGVFDDVFPVLVTYMISQPDVEEYARQKGIAVYYSFDF